MKDDPKYQERMFNRVKRYHKVHHRPGQIDIMAERFEVCKACPQYTGNNCRLMGCTQSHWLMRLTEDGLHCPENRFLR